MRWSRYWASRLPSPTPSSFPPRLFATAHGEINTIFVTAQGAGLVDFALIPHLDHEDHPDASAANAEKWAARLPVPVYGIDDQTAIKAADGTVEVVSVGHWKLFTP